MEGVPPFRDETAHIYRVRYSEFRAISPVSCFGFGENLSWGDPMICRDYLA